MPLIANRVYVVTREGVIFEGAPEETFAERDMLSQAGLEQPTLASLAYVLQRLGVELPLPARVEDAAGVIADAIRGGARVGEARS